MSRQDALDARACLAGSPEAYACADKRHHLRLAQRQDIIGNDRERSLRLAAFRLVQLDLEGALDADRLAFVEPHQFGLHAFGKRGHAPPLRGVAVFDADGCLTNGLPAFEVRASGARKSAPVMIA